MLCQFWSPAIVFGPFRQRLLMLVMYVYIHVRVRVTRSPEMLNLVEDGLVSVVCVCVCGRLCCWIPIHVIM